MESNSDFSYRMSFEEEKQKTVERVLRWGQGGREKQIDFSDLESIVAIKNTERRYTAENAIFRNMFMEGRSTIGGNTDRRLDQKFLRLSKDIDHLIFDGVFSVQIEHTGTLPNGRICNFLTYKRRLDELRDPTYLILMISRPLGYVAESEEQRRRSLSDCLRLLQQLDETDQLICRGYADGDGTKEIAARVGRTTRSVEIRRQKIMNLFGFSRPIEIVKMIVRLEERGLL